MSSILTLAGNNTSDASFYPHTIDQSLRFEDGDTPRLRFGTGTPTNAKIFTQSFWIKRGELDADNYFYSTFVDGSNENKVRFKSDNTFDYVCLTSGSILFRFISTQVFRDVASFYNLVFAIDTTQSTSSNRVKIYLNGTQITAFSTETYPSQNAEPLTNQASKNFDIGNHNGSPFDGYLSEVVFVDGSALTADSFGEFKDGIWVPKDVSGLTFGNNGFHLDFADSSAIGNDVSGNDNDFTVTGLVASDVVLDSPTNKFPVINSLDPLLSYRGLTLSEGNLRIQGGTGGPFSANHTFGYALIGNYYAEFYVEATAQTSPSAVHCLTTISGATFNYQFRANGDIRKDGTTVATVSAFNAGDIIGANGSTDDNTVEFFVNGVSVYTDTHTSDFESVDLYPRLDDTTTPIFICNYGQDSTFAGNTSAGGNSDSAGIGDFKYTVPAGAKAICSANLPEPAIIDGSEYFNTVLYTGDGTSGQAITGVGHSPDFVWIKKRSASGSHQLFDTIRGATNRLNSNSNNAEASFANTLQSFDADGFTVGGDGDTGGSGLTYVSWNWLAGTAVSGATTGSGTAKTYTGSVNTEAGFSIIKYVGNGTSGHTIPHNLTATPTMIIVKRLDSTGGWRVQHKDVAATHYLALDTTAAEANLDTIFNDTAFDSTVFTVGNASSINDNDKDYIAYCFTDIDQYLKAGVYSGNGNADGTYIHLGFRPAWLMVKRTNSTGQWDLFDNKRETFNEMGNQLRADATNAEASNDHDIDFLSNGFKWRDSSNSINASGSTYIYLAFAEQPFKYANAR